MNCASCGKPSTTVEKCNNPLGHDFGAGYSGNSATSSNASGWKGINPISGDGDRAAVGLVQAASGIEPHPCQHCRSFENAGTGRMASHFKAHGCIIDEQGMVTTPIAKDFPGRRSLKLDLRVFGWCRLLTIPVDVQATCGRWEPTKAAARFLGMAAG